MLRPRHIPAAIVFACLLFMNSCSKDFLEITPTSELDQAVLANFDGVDALLIGAYSMLDGVSESFGWESATSGWLYSSIRGMESNKGTDSGDSVYDLNQIQNFCESNEFLDFLGN